ncbi:MAG: hypothetical protein K940chlam3_00932, partial [Chlamydiae bacterium]|nr:hypothetical protein [Chlamydiota bacterium]
FAVILYSILPTIFWYSKPLKQEIGPQKAQEVAVQAINRVNGLEKEAIEWIGSFNNLLGIQARSVELDSQSPRFIYVRFEKERDAKLFKRFIQRAGVSIPFVPAQLRERPDATDVIPQEDGLYTVIVERNIGVHLDPSQVDQLFTFSKKFTEDREIVPFYRDLVYSRVSEVSEAIVGPSLQGVRMEAIVNNPKDKRLDDLALTLAAEIKNVNQTFGPQSPIAKRYFASFTQIDNPNKSQLVRQFTSKLESLRDGLKSKLSSLQTTAKQQTEEGKLVDVSATQSEALIERQIKSLNQAIGILKDNQATFASGKKPLTKDEFLALMSESEKTIDKKDYIQKINLEGYHPFISNLYIDWTDDIVQIRFYPDIQKKISLSDSTESAAIARENINRLLFNSIALISRLSDETLKPHGDDFVLNLNSLTNSTSLLTMDLGKLAQKESNQIISTLKNSWSPSHKELKVEVFPIRSYEQYRSESSEDQKLGLVIYSPAAADSSALPKGFNTGSLYVIVKGFDRIASKYGDSPESDPSKQFAADFTALRQLLMQYGFQQAPINPTRLAKEFQKDLIFTYDNYYSDLIAATREEFQVKGDKKFAVLEFTDVEQRLLANNKIEDRMQEDLVKWQESYISSQVDLDPAGRYVIPRPTRNPYWSNIKLSARKYFRGDDRKILKWGLDLSGGKTVRIGLRDQDNRPVSNPDDLKQAMNELYTRVNKMGVSERTIRTENDTIILDFPGSQAFSANELIKASAMYFHIANEKFGQGNRDLAPVVNQFLQEVWDEAVVTNRKDIDNISEIAWRHLGGDPENPESLLPKSENAQILVDNGLRLANPYADKRTSTFNDTLSMVAMYRGEDTSEWYRQFHPLLFVFNNYALEGSSLSNVSVGLDPKEGYVLHFEVKSSYEGKKQGEYGSPQQDLYSWTSQFAEERISGTPKAEFAPRGWRMAVILNGKVVSAPTLRAALNNNGTISGRFTPREINQLAADLKAGSLSYTPKILSEHNVSPELGKEERNRGIFASCIALVLVIIVMVSVYRFAGVIASCAVLINLLIMWGFFQSIGYALTLPGIAGVVLTIGMAVDANVLVFERIREEFAISGRIASAIQAGYRKAFSAIVDSNITTLMAAFILIQFDSGPIKGFAVVLIIGLLSSMFTALFLTRYFFAGWVQNPKHTELKMLSIFHKTKINFLKYTKPAYIISALLIIAGTYLLVMERNTLFGMDFTGGYSLMVDFDEKPDTNYRLDASEALLAAGATQGDIEIRELSHPNQLRIQLGMSMEEPGHPFYGLPIEKANGSYTFNYEQNPRITWVVNALAEQGLQIQEIQLINLDKNWSLMSGQLSDTMRNSAMMALTVALVGILLYITFRFEFKYAISAVIALAHDVWITLGIVALFHLMGFAIEINLQAIGAIMTIIGYSLNDTIIVFDRIREEVRVMRKSKFTEVVNHALNITLNRTLMTSGTTLLVLMSLVLFGGPSIFGFALIMAIGVLVGTFSSLFIASPVMLWVHNQILKRDGLKVEI